MQKCMYVWMNEFTQPYIFDRLLPITCIQATATTPLDVDECQSQSTHECHDERECNNEDGSYTCDNCAAGWTNDGDKGCTGTLFILNLVIFYIVVTCS